MARLSRQQFEDHMDKKVGEFLDELEEKVKSCFVFTPDVPTSSGVIGTQARIAKEVYK